MDLIRIFIDTTFSKISERYFASEKKLLPSLSINSEDKLIIDEALFVDECRTHHPELSDDQIRMIFGLYRDEWAMSPNDYSFESTPDRYSLFNVLFKFTTEVLRLKNKEPLVIFRHLLRWRELSLNVGEDILVAAFLAFHNRDMPDVPSCVEGNIRNKVFFDGIDFCSWPTILHNDNPHLNYIFMNNKLCELHSHLYASTDNFSISWVSLMNSIKNRKNDFKKLAKTHDKSRCEQIASLMYSYAILACSMRLNLWRFINKRENNLSVNLKDIQLDVTRASDRLQDEIQEENVEGERMDYIVCDIISPMSVIAGERKFLYGVLKYILHDENALIERCFYEYLLAKNKIRSFFIQINNNRGFTNFKRYQDLKTAFMGKRYREEIGKLAVWEAMKLNYTNIFETRIAPFSALKDLSGFRKKSRSIDTVRNKNSDSEWSLLVHFLKHPENFKDRKEDGPREYVRDMEMRTALYKQSIVLRQVEKIAEWETVEDSYLSRIRGIDAASSEIGCRPEIFAQAFRFLKAAGYAATFHVGEDFYDITDGLRAIDEAVSFLGLEAGDRLGHVLALGIDPYEFYKERHNYIALPVQWMLDNMVWLYYSSRKYNVSIEPETEDFLVRTFRDLVRRIGYEKYPNDGEANTKIEMIDYYQSMLLRGDAPDHFGAGGEETQKFVSFSWNHYRMNPSEELKEIRKWNIQARALLLDYWNTPKIIANGRKIKSFKVPSNFYKLIRCMQEEMIKMVSKKQLGIECCPSSNYKIGYCKRYDRHPIFRFMPVKLETTNYPLSVTVNTDDLGIFSTSLPNEYSLLALAIMKMKDADGNHIYSTQEVYDWVERIIKNGEKYYFKRPTSFSLCENLEIHPHD